MKNTMQFLPKIDYPDFEQAKLRELDELFHLWYNETKKNKLPDGYSAEHLVFDGFYPYYTKQNQKILFIGREARGLSDYHYIEVLFKAYKNNRIGNQHINTNFFAKRMFYISYGIIKGFPEWQKIPWADEISETFGTERGISFSFMNISKFSNDSDSSWQSNWDLINASYELSNKGKKSMIAIEIEILEPDIIISMDLGDKMNAFGEVKEIKRSHQVNTHILNTETKKNILLLDTFHFAAPRKNDENDFYIPIIEAIKEHKMN
jgi:hypothetical protein